MQTFGQGEDHPLRKRATDDLEDAAVSYVASKLGINASSVAWKSGFSGEVAHHAFVRQQLVSLFACRTWSDLVALKWCFPERYPHRQCRC